MNKFCFSMVNLLFSFVVILGTMNLTVMLILFIAFGRPLDYILAIVNGMLVVIGTYCSFSIMCQNSKFPKTYDMEESQDGYQN